MEQKIGICRVKYSGISEEFRLDMLRLARRESKCLSLIFEADEKSFTEFEENLIENCHIESINGKLTLIRYYRFDDGVLEKLFSDESALGTGTHLSFYYRNGEPLLLFCDNASELYFFIARPYSMMDRDETVNAILGHSEANYTELKREAYWDKFVTPYRMMGDWLFNGEILYGESRVKAYALDQYDYVKGCRSDIKGKDFKEILSKLFEYSSVFSLNYDRNNLPDTPLNKYLIKSYDLPDNEFYHIKYFKCTEETKELILDISDSLFEFIYNPEDFRFFRTDGSLLFNSVIHEGECWLYPRDNEDISDILNKFPTFHYYESSIYWYGIHGDVHGVMQPEDFKV